MEGAKPRRRLAREGDRAEEDALLAAARRQLVLVDYIGHHRAEAHERLLHNQPLHEAEHRERRDQVLCAVLGEDLAQAQHHRRDLADCPARGADHEPDLLVPFQVQVARER